MSADAMRTTLRRTKALADQQRLRMLMLLRDGELCVCQIIEILGLAPSTVSKHLSILDAADLVVCRKDGRWAYYRRGKDADVRPLFKWVDDRLADDPVTTRDRKRLAYVRTCDPVQLSKKQRSVSP